MLDSFFYWSGVVFWLLLAITFGWGIKIVFKDAHKCAVFTIRRVRYLPHGGFKDDLPLYRTAVRYWFFLWWGSYHRPAYVYDPDTDVIVWFPGKENSETVYEEYGAPRTEENK